MVESWLSRGSVLRGEKGKGEDFGFESFFVSR